MSSDINKKIFRSTTWSLASKVTAQAITFITTIYLAKLLGISDFGAINFGMLTVGLIDSIVDFGFLSAIVRERTITNEQLSTCFWFLLFISIIGIILIHVYTYIYPLESAYISVIEVLVYGLIFVPFQSITRGLVSRDLRLDTIAKYELFGGLIRNILSITGAFLGYGVKGFVYGFLCERIFVSICLGFATGWYPRFQFRLSSIKSFISFGVANVAARIVWYLSTKIDSFFIGLYFGKDALGLYALAMQIANMPFQLVTTGVHRVIYASFSKFTESPSFSYIIRKAAWLVLAFSAPACIGIYIISDLFVDVFFEEKWHPASEILKWLSLASLVQIYASVWPQFWNAIGKPSYGVVLNTVNIIVLSMILYYVGIYGDFEDIPIAVFLTSIFRLLIVCLLSKKLIKISFVQVFYESLFPLTGAALFFAWKGFSNETFTYSSDVFNLITLISGAAIIYLSFMLFSYKMPGLPVKKFISK
ncbi:hypothetical protein A1359_11710 [Methylomonas lenta]|uniref:Lipopolysaccharide biosynthesis protein n=1 Tax=Methylomonas lenta TaxID=980561 RepID=A0A177N8F2_9GAMM|nr:oligosaccharide flippase family protein [Methylomonas lenta]OAI13773.1 hypothetical protein A1359_11710 [Methylomonas lenta]